MGSILTTHITKHDLSSKNQWEYKKDCKTEMLLVKMTEDWRTALDSNLMGGVYCLWTSAKISILNPTHALLLKMCIWSAPVQLQHLLKELKAEGKFNP